MADAVARGLSGWDERDVQDWRRELAAQRKGESTRKIGTALVAAGISYIGACSWIPVTKLAGCPKGKGCEEMTIWEMLVFSMYVAVFTLGVITLTYLLYTIKQRLTHKIEAEAEDLAEVIRNDDARSTVARERLSAGVKEGARLATIAHGRSFDMIAGNTIYACVFLWTLSLHSFTSYTTRSGVWTYFAFALVVCSALTVLSFEVAPALTTKIRAACPMLAPANPTDEAQLVLVARTFAGSMAYLLAIGLVNALEVTIVRSWPVGDPRPCYYSGSLHNIPLAARYVLCVVIWALMIPALALLKRSKNSVLRDTVVTALMDRGDWGAAAFCMRLWDRMRGLYLPTLSWTAGQALLRSVDHTLTPHSWDIFLTPETISEQTGGSDNSTAAQAAAAAAAASLVASGCDTETAEMDAGALTDSSTAGGADAATENCKHQLAAANAAQDRSFGAACAAATSTQCSFDSQDAGGGGCLKWAFTGRCYSSDPALDCSSGFEPFKGEWSEAGQHQCEAVNSCVYQNGTDVFGICCEKKVLYGQQLVLFMYCCAVTAGATVYLANRDARMLAKLEHTIGPWICLACFAFPCLAFPCLALPCLALPCLALPCLALPCLALPCLALPCLLLWSSSQLHPSCSLCSTIPDYPDSSGCLACFVDGCSVNREAGHERGARAARIRPTLGACGNVRWPVFVYGRQNLERICWVRAAYIFNLHLPRESSSSSSNPFVCLRPASTCSECEGTRLEQGVV
jgi:hypothetical protein